MGSVSTEQGTAELEQRLQAGTRQDGVLVNVATKMGTSRDRNTHTKVGLPYLLARTELEALYTGSWLCRRIIHLPAGEATRAGWNIGLGDQEQKTARKNSAKLVAYGERLRLRRYVREALRQARLYGGAAILVLVDDGATKVEALAEEIRWKNLKRIKGFHVLDRDRIWPAPGWGGVGEPEAYQFNTESDPKLVKVGGMEGHQTVEVHASRVLRIEGEPAPVDLRGALNWWGVSVLQEVFDVFKRYETGQQSASQILHDFDVFVHKIPDLQRMIAAGRQEEVTRRFEVQELVRSVFGSLVLGGEEEGNFITRSAAGISDVLMQLKTEVTGASRIPHTKLWGESPSGLGATGRSEDQAFAADVADMQDDILSQPLRQFYEIAMKAADAPFRDPPDDWNVIFKPTYVRTMEETAELYGKVAGAGSQWVNAGVLQPHELAVGHFGSPEFSLDINLIDREPDGSIAQEEFDPSQVSFGGALAPPALDANGQMDPKPPARPYPGPAGAQVEAPPAPRRTDAADGEGHCCSSCAAGLECEQDCPGGSCATDGQPAAAQPAQPGEGELEHTLQTPDERPRSFEAVAAALTVEVPKARDRRGRARARADANPRVGLIRVAGCAVMAGEKGTGHLVGEYGQATPYRAIVGRGDSGAWEVITPAGEWFVVLGEPEGAKVQAAAGAGAQIRRIDSIDLVAMGIRCDAYDS
jgi:phage-related protein (TIGR01555 family)